jgi:hypothetical protein
VASPLVQTVNAVKPVRLPVADGPTVESVKRYGIRVQPTVLLIRFNEPLDPTSAASLSNYKITSPAGRSVHIRSAVLNAETDTVTLRPAKRISIHRRYHLTVIGASPGGVRNTTGIMLDETSTGVPDGNYTCTLTRRNLVLPPMEVRRFVRPGQATPAGPLNPRLLHPSH